MKLTRLSAVLCAVLCFASAHPAIAQPFLFKTIAGNAGYGLADGPGQNARFDAPAAIALGASNVAYVADMQNHIIRKITSDGHVTTFAGTPGARGSKDSPNARFNLPQGIAVDASNDVYVADTGNNTIRFITAAGIVSTLAGKAGTHGSQDGTGSNAFFNAPQGITVDASNNVYVADTFNQTIRKITAGGAVATIAGVAGVSGATNTADTVSGISEFAFPRGVAADASNNVFVADTGNNTVRKIDASLNVTTLAGKAGFPGSTDSTNSAARFNFPEGIATDSSNNIYVADTDNFTVRKITPAGKVSTLAGLVGISGSRDGGTNGTNAALFNAPQGVAVGAGATNIFIADTQNNIIRLLAGTNVSALAGLAGSTGTNDGTNAFARFNAPQGAVVDGAKNIYIADTQNHTIREITPTGVVTTIAGLAGTPGIADGTNMDARFFHPYGLAIDAATNLYVADRDNNEIREVSPDGTNWIVSTLAGQPGVFFSGEITNAEDGLTNVTNVPITNASTITNFSIVFTNVVGNVTNLTLFITNVPTLTNIISGQTNVIKLTANVFILTNIVHSMDGMASNAIFYEPTGVALDGSGNIYVTDMGNSTVRLLSGGMVSTFVGTTGTNGSTDSRAGTPQFFHPSGIAMASSGNIYVSDTANCAIRQITPGGKVSTIAGLAGAFGNRDATNNTARFGSPQGMAIDVNGNIFVADTINDTIRKIAPSGLNWVVTTVGGSDGISGNVDAVGTNALFNAPADVAVDDAGGLYVVDTGNNTVRAGVIAPATPPTLGISQAAGKLVLTWPAAANGFVLETSGSIASNATWTPVTAGISTSGTNLVLTNQIGAPNSFYRLHAQE